MTLGRKVLFSTPLGQTFQQFSNFLCLFMSSFSKTFQNNLNYAYTLNIREVVKFHSLDNKSSETDFREKYPNGTPGG